MEKLQILRCNLFLHKLQKCNELMQIFEEFEEEYLKNAVTRYSPVVKE